ncbi:MAG: hypothetical protein ISR55_11845 [Bacteroidetes bacterium]|nr:hypothetical protein [Bacteroidota bacterium]MBL6964508.1 hypothetical protein [Bacteroidota bacterium]
MNSHKIFKLFLISILVSAIFTCKDDDVPKKEKSSLEVFVKKYNKDGPKVGNATVELFLTKNARDMDDVYKTAVSPATDFDINGALFEDLAAQVYYLRTAFTDSGHVFEGIAEIALGEKEDKEMDIFTSYAGSWQVFVREGQINGPNVGNAKVEIFLTESDRMNGNAMDVKYTPSTGFDSIGVMFEDLPYQKYYLRGSYTNAKGYWVGVAEGFAKRNQTNNKVIVAVL